MEVIALIAVIGFLIWLFSGSSSSKNNTNSTYYQPKFDHYSELNRKQEEEEKKRRELEEKRKKEIAEDQKRQRNNAIHNQDTDVRKERILDNYRIEYFFHITHKDNLNSILQNGLYSHNTAYSRGLNNQEISNNDVIQIRSRKKDPINSLYINDYAPLYINPKLNSSCKCNFIVRQKWIKYFERCHKVQFFSWSVV